MPSFSIACGERADAEAGGVLGAEVLVDDDDGEAEFHGAGFLFSSCIAGANAGSRGAGRCLGRRTRGRRNGKARIMGRFARGGYEKCADRRRWQRDCIRMRQAERATGESPPACASVARWATPACWPLHSHCCCVSPRVLAVANGDRPAAVSPTPSPNPAARGPGAGRPSRHRPGAPPRRGTVEAPAVGQDSPSDPALQPAPA